MARNSVQYNLLISLLALLLGGCAAARITRPVPLVSAPPAAAVAEHLLLDITVNLFTPVADVSSASVDGLQSLRTAESHYLGWQLARTLQASSQWGTVQLNPFAHNGADLNISGTLLQSDGETLRIRISVADASGRRWLDREYLQVVDADSYAAALGTTPPFPFQHLLNRISNDILAFRQSRLMAADLENIRKISALAFAADFAPETYGAYLGNDREGRFVLERLPSAADPVFAQIATMRARNALFLDAIQAQYAVYIRQVDEPYRKFLARSQVITGILNGRFRARENEEQYGAATLLSAGIESRNRTGSRFSNANKRSDALNTGSYARIYSAALAEAGSSFEMVVQPQTLALSAHTVDLSGSLEEQFAQWRELLGELHALDTAP